MDKPTTPAGPNATPRPEDSGSEQDFGATGVFGLVKPPDPIKPSEPVRKPEPGWGAVPNDRAAEAARPQPPLPPAPQPVQPPNAISEPMVHKVVFGGGAAASSPELLDRMRMASAERAPAQQSAPAAPKAPEPPVVGGASGGFTQLLRTLETDPPAQPPPPVAPGLGGFTELLRAIPAGGTEFGGAQTQPSGQGQAPVAGWAAQPSPSPAANKPGTFTQLFGTLDGTGTPPAEPPVQAAGNASISGPGSFTRMLSIEQHSAPPAAPPFAAAPCYEERKPSPGSLDYGQTPQAARPVEASRDPFAPAPLPEAQPPQSASGTGSVGITRLIRMLDEPNAQPPIEAAPAPVARSSEPGIWTQTFASLAEPAQPTAPAARAPEWIPPQPPAPTLPATNYSAPPVAPSPSAGPSEFTRILDASRMRELAMQGGQAPAAPAPPPPPPQQSFAPTPIPSYQPPAPPSVGGMPGYGGFPPPQPPAYPMSYPPQPAPAMSTPPAPAMSAPALPPKPAPAAPAPGTGKTQQYLLLMGVVIIFLLVAILVTVIFVMKH